MPLGLAYLSVTNAFVLLPRSDRDKDAEILRYGTNSRCCKRDQVATATDHFPPAASDWWRVRFCRVESALFATLGNFIVACE